MAEHHDDNAAIWKSDERIQDWVASASEREKKHAAPWRIIADLLPFDQNDAFTFLDLGAGTGAAARMILSLYPNSRAILADYSPQMISEGSKVMGTYDGRFEYVEFDMLEDPWPSRIPDALNAIVTSLCIHHLPNERKQTLFGEIFSKLMPGGWYFNYDPVTQVDKVVDSIWKRALQRSDPDAMSIRAHRTPEEQERHENHTRYMIPLDQQLEYLRSAGFQGIDIYWKHLENVIYGGCRPSN